MEKIKKTNREAVVLFAGDSGDGMQLTGTQFTTTHALFGNDVATFPDFPAEIRAPQGTVGGVSGFKVRFGSNTVYTPGDMADVLVVMNAAALKANISKLRKGGVLIANEDGFDSKNLKLSKTESNPLESGELDNYQVITLPVSQLTTEALKDSELDKKEILRSKNMFVLGVLYWMFDRDLDTTRSFLESKFSSKPHLMDANLAVLKAGYHFGETSELFTHQIQVDKAKLAPGEYRSIMGNQATALGLIAASKKAGLDLFYGSYPITPASDILHELAKHKSLGVKTFQAEDEIAAATAAIGASFGGALGVTASSGPGIALKGESIGLAVMLELPLVVINVQRGGPSTGLPTKTEQADLMQALFGRNGEAQMPVLAASSPSDAFDTVYEATKIALEWMTPVMVLSDGYIANGSEPWRFPQSKDLEKISTKKIDSVDGEFLPYKRDEKLVRSWAIPGTEGLEHRIGGLEKEELTGNVSYDPMNHERMVLTRAQKVKNIADAIPAAELELGEAGGRVLVLGWGSTYGAVRTAVEELIEEGHEVAQMHLRHVHPFPKGMKELLDGFDTVLMPEINEGQLIHIVQSELDVRAVRLNKIQGLPFSSTEIKDKVKDLLNLNSNG